MTDNRRRTVVDAIGLGCIVLALADYLRPELLFVSTIPAGGDTPCHYPTFLYLRDHLLPQWRLHGWYPGAYLGQPLLLDYFPLAFLFMCALSLLVPPPIAFKLGVMGGVFLLPLAAYAALRLLRFRAPSPLLGAAGTLVFLFIEDNPIWGGTLASTIVGEFSYTYGLGLAVLFLAVVYHAHSEGRSFGLPAACLALVALAHGYAVLWAGLTATYLFYVSRRPLRTLALLATTAGGAFVLAGFWLVPLLADWRFTTPYADPWITVGLRNLFPPLLLPLAALASGGVVWTLVVDRRRGGADHRILYLAHAVVVSAALAGAAPVLGIIGVRFVPFAHASVAVLGGAVLGRLVSRLRAPGAAALALVIASVLGADQSSRVLRGWAEWDLSGLEAKELWPAFRKLSERLKGTVADPRVAVEYSRTHERAGSIRVYETLPLFSGRSTLEGVYNQASLQTHAVYYLASELGESSSRPFRSRYYSELDTDAAVEHLRLFNTRDIVALSPRLVASLQARPDATRVATIPPYTLFRLGGDWSYVEPMRYAPVRSDPGGWREKAYRWFTRKPLSKAHLVFTDDPRIDLVEGDPYLAPAELPLPDGVTVAEDVKAEQITIRTSRVGHPLLVKVSYHPRWTVEGGRGPYLVSPALMMVLPEQPIVRLRYGRNAADAIGGVLTLCALLLVTGRAVLGHLRARPGTLIAPKGETGEERASVARSRHWGWLVPGGVIVVLCTLRLLPSDNPSARADEAQQLYESASQAYSQGRFAAAAEYLRLVLVLRPDTALRHAALARRGESLLRDGRPGEAAADFSRLLADRPRGDRVAQALFGLAVASEGTGDQQRAVDAAGRLLGELGDTAWASRLRTEHPRLTQPAAGKR